MFWLVEWLIGMSSKLQIGHTPFSNTLITKNGNSTEGKYVQFVSTSTAFGIIGSISFLWMLAEVFYHLDKHIMTTFCFINCIFRYNIAQNNCKPLWHVLLPRSSGASALNIIGDLPGSAESWYFPVKRAQEWLADRIASQAQHSSDYIFACFMLWNQTPLNCSIFNCWIAFHLDHTEREKKWF